MSWAEVKKINSNMAKPLDELINGTKGLVASDNLYKNIALPAYNKTFTIYAGTETITSTATYTFPFKIKFNWDGSVKFQTQSRYSLVGYTSSASARVNASMKIDLMDGDTRVSTIANTSVSALTVEGTTPVTSTKTASTNVIYETSKEYTIKVTFTCETKNPSSYGRSDMTMSVSAMDILADLIDISGITII